MSGLLRDFTPHARVTGETCTDHDNAIEDSTSDCNPSNYPELLASSSEEATPERFVVRNILAEGGNASVYKAWDAFLQKHVALKVLQVDSGCSEVTLRHEVSISQRVSHPSIVRTHDVVMFRNTMCVSMELVEGPDLARVLLERGKLDPSSVITMARHLCAGLACAHRAGVVHCDLKPGNILLDRGLPRIADFGLAIDSSAPITHCSRGTLAYMSPEQKQGLPVDQRTDVYSLGVVLFEMLAARLPSRAELNLATAKSLRKVLSRSPLRLRVFIATCLQTNPDDRFINGEEMLAALDRMCVTLPSRTVGLLNHKLAWPRIYLIVSFAIASALIMLYRHHAFAQDSPKPRDVKAIVLLPTLPEDSSQDVADAIDDYLFSVFQQASGAQVWRIIPGAQKSVSSSAYDNADYIVSGSVKLAAGYPTVALKIVSRKGQFADLSMHVSGSTLLELVQKLSTRLADEKELASFHIHSWIPHEYEGRTAASFSLYERANGIFRWQNKREQSLGESVKLLTRAINMDPACAICLARRAEAEMALYKKVHLQRYRSDAVQDIHRTLTLDDSSAPVIFTAAQLLLDALERAEAIDLLSGAKEPIRCSSTAHRMMGNLLLDDELYSYAVAELKQAVLLNPIDAGALDSLGFAQLMVPDYNEAIRTFTRLVSLDSNDAAAQNNLAGALLRAGHFADAIQPLRASLRIHESAASYANLGMALFYTGQRQDALTCFEHAAALEPTAEFIGDLAHAYRWLGVGAKAKAQYELAIARAREQMRTEQKDGLLQSDLALFHAALGEKDIALSYIQQARQKNPVNLDVLYKSAVAMALLGLQERAIEDLQRLSSRAYPIAFASGNPDLLSLDRFPEFQQLKQAMRH